MQKINGFRTLSLSILGTALLLSHHATAQQAAAPAIVHEEWSSSPALHSLDPKYKSESAVVLLDKRRVEYVDQDKKDMAVYRTIHKIIRVNDDNGIESYNKVYLGISDENSIVDIHARTILPGGRIIEVDKKNIKDLKEDDGNLYKIFAMEGLEKGCEVEYYYTFKRDASFFGRETLQNQSPVLDAELEILAPKRLVFEMKGFNMNPLISDTIIGDERIVKGSKKDIMGVDNEKYAEYKANLGRVEYKLAYNTAGNTDERLFTWNELAKRVYYNYSTCSPKETKKAIELVSSSKWDHLGSDEEKIIAVENYLKKNFTVREDIPSGDGDDVEKIIKNHIASNHGIVRLYGAIFTQLAVDHQYVLTADRNECSIDKSFENWNNLENAVLYFPSTKKLLAPTVAALRYPWISPDWCGANALFCKSTTIGSFTTALADIRTIPVQDYTHTCSNIESRIRFNSACDTALVDLKLIDNGYSAVSYRLGYTFGSPDDKHAMLKELVKSYTNSESIVSSNFINTEIENASTDKPFILEASVKANELVERAGNKILFKLGMTIGPQSEMYQEKARQFPISMPYPHIEDRKIDIVIPDGYTVKNLNDINISNVYTEDGDTTMGFVSSYTREGSLLHVHIHEEYRKISYPISQYEDFRKIINASADFNKIVLVLEKS